MIFKLAEDRPSQAGLDFSGMNGHWKWAG